MTVTHMEAIAQLREQLALVFDRSSDGVYLWLDDEAKVCNERLATMFGYSADEWKETNTPFLETFIAADDREVYSKNYHEHVVGAGSPITFRFRGLRRDGSTFLAETDMIPVGYGPHPIAYHFVREVV